MPESRLLLALRRFQESKSEFVVVGGVAAVLNGAPIQTYDIDLVYSRRPENVERLLAVLTALDAVYRMQPERRLRPTASHLFGSGHLNLLTNAGPLDLLATIGRNLSYEDLVPYFVEMDIGNGMRVQVLNLEMLIALKEELGGERDLAVLPVLRQTLRELRRRTGLS